MNEVKVTGNKYTFKEDTNSFPNYRRFRHPYEYANPLSKLFFIWILPFLKLGASKNLTLKDLYPIRRIDVTEDLGNEIEAKWDAEFQVAKKNGRQPRLIWVLGSMFWKTYIWTFLLETTTECTLAVSLPILFRWFILSFDDANDTITRTDQYIYAAAVCCNTLLNSLLIHVVYFNVQSLSMRCRSALISLIYRKSLRLSSVGPNPTSLGHVLNLSANDVHRFEDALLNAPFIVIGPIQFVLFSYILLQEIGYPALVGVAFVILLMPFQYFLGKYTTLFRLQAAERTDERARFMNEIINGIRVIKMYAWEVPFSTLIHKLRALEVKSLKKISYLIGCSAGFFISAVQMVILVTIVTFILAGNGISSDKVFYAVAIFNVFLSTAIYYIPHSIMGIGAALVTCRRLEKYLMKHEQGTSGNELLIQEKPINSEPTLEMKGVKASWTLEKTTLNNLTLKLSGDKIVMVIGAVGSGKSSFLSTIIAELPILSGQCVVQGITSYASQEAWIFSGTVRQNILFGCDYDDVHYNHVVDVCALQTDFVQFEYGDATLVGERGITLSGGQKARINLARALYRKADIYLLDDPLSAVDTKVSKHIFEKCIKTFLRGKLRVLVTHQLQYLPKADHIIILTKEGEIYAQGTFSELQGQNIDFLNILKGGEHEEDGDETRRRSRTTSHTIVERDDEGTMLPPQEQESQDEFIAYGKVSSAVYGSYFRASKSMCSTISIFAGFVLVQAILSGAYWWLAFWTNYEDSRQKTHLPSIINATTPSSLADGNLPNGGNYLYLWVYIGFVLASVSSVFIAALSYFRYTMKVSINIHDNMFQNLVRAPTKFFDTNPPGRILNRVTRDLSQMDLQLPEIMYDTVTISLRVLGTVIIVILANYYILVPTGILFVVFYFARWYYVKTIRDVKRLEAVSRSPIFTHLSSSFQGIATIRSSKSQAFVLRQFEAHVDQNTVVNFMYLATMRWFAVWLEMTAISYFAAITFGFLVLTTSSLPGSVGMAMASIMELNLYFQWGMRQSSELENNMTSVERIQEYANVASEGRLHCDPKLDASWITAGEIKFDSVSLVYDEKPVLKNLSFTIKAQEKIGIVGRTGAGKSSIITAIFRLTEPTGSIYIDNVRINDVGLHDVRQNISIIPQEPQLFSGTLRFNLDPFNEFEDLDLWRELEEVALKDVVTDLNMLVADGGSNFSVGERQLVCLARAALRNNKIIVMDEATANVDPKTDYFIQQTIRKKFSLCTIITIAHRLQSVMDCDRILVLESGELKEYDHPHALLQNPDGFFKSLIDQTGKSAGRNLSAIAEENFKAKPN